VAGPRPLGEHDRDRPRLRLLPRPRGADLPEPAPGNARCVACHSSGGGNAFLEPLPPGRETWDEEQSFRNFERVQRLVVPGEPLASLLLVNPLVEEAGGSHWHAGGKHWTTQDAGEWQTLAEWVQGRIAP
jgi:hypothetical protein